MGTLSTIADIASLVGFVFAAITLIVAARVRRIVTTERNRLIRRIRIQEIRSLLMKELKPLNGSITSDQAERSLTIVHRIAANLRQLEKHGSPQLSEAVKSALSGMPSLAGPDRHGQRAALCGLRDRVVHVIAEAENLERDLAWSESNG